MWHLLTRDVRHINDITWALDMPPKKSVVQLQSSLLGTSSISVFNEVRKEEESNSKN